LSSKRDSYNTINYPNHLSKTLLEKNVKSKGTADLSVYGNAIAESKHFFGFLATLPVKNLADTVFSAIFPSILPPIWCFFCIWTHLSRHGTQTPSCSGTGVQAATGQQHKYPVNVLFVFLKRFYHEMAVVCDLYQSQTLILYTIRET
jgi:hypothetical protein